VGRNNSRSEAASEALVGSLAELVASSSNFGLARTTKTSPDWLGIHKGGDQAYGKMLFHRICTRFDALWKCALGLS